MKPIYNFERQTPPVLYEKNLVERALNKKLQKQTALLAAGGLLLQICLLALAFVIRFESPVCSIALYAYVVASLAGFAVISILMTSKRRKLKCVLPL